MNGFFNAEALEALQEAYKLQLTPDEMDIDTVTGLPTNQVSNTSPWHGQVELWKYPNGVVPQAKNEIHYLHDDEDQDEEIYDDDDEEIYDDDDDSIDSGYGVDPEELGEEADDEDAAEMSEEEVEALIADLLEEG